MWEAIENQRPAAWRVIFKGLTLTEHLVKNGSERCVDDARNHSHLLRSLDKFNYYEGTVDRGVGVREKAKQLVDILGDDERIREERMKARQLREKFAGRGGSASNSSGGGGGSKYAGYGNSDAAWASAGASKGYGESGIGSGGDRGYAGRYGEGGIGGSGPGSPTPKATMVKDVPQKSAKVKKIKKKEKTPAPGACQYIISCYCLQSSLLIVFIIIFSYIVTSSSRG
jgi:epsin